MEIENMENQKSRKVSSLVMGMLILFSTLVVMNFASMNARATDIPWNNGHTVSGTEWYENCNITMQNGNLTIEEGGELIFNDTVTFKIMCPSPGFYGINIETGGKFEINSNNADTEITYGSAQFEDSYSFLNSGTIDFLGATVERVYGNPSDKTNTGGIRNMPGSICNLTCCSIMDADTHSLVYNGTEAHGVCASIYDIWITNTTTNVMNGTGIQIAGNSTLMLDYAMVSNNQNYGIKCVDSSSTVTISNSTIENCQYGIHCVNSSINITKGNYLNYNNCSVYLYNSSMSMGLYSGEEMDLNEESIQVPFAEPGPPAITGNIIIGNPLMANQYGIYVNQSSALIYDNYISSNRSIYVIDSDSVDIYANYLQGLMSVTTINSSAEIGWNAWWGAGNVPEAMQLPYSGIEGLSNSDLHIFNNSVLGLGFNEAAFIQLRDSESTMGIHDNVISNNQYEYGWGCRRAIYLDSSSPAIENNTIYYRNGTESYANYGIICENNSNPYIYNNSIFNLRYIGITVNNSSPVIDSNTIYANELYGIFLNNSDNIIIMRNNLTDNGCGIFLNNSDEGIIINNTVSLNIYEGIRAFNSNITLINNTISENIGSGVWIENCTGGILNNTIGNSHTPVSNETVYGPTFGYGNDPSRIYLDHGLISDCSLYLDYCIGWCLLVEDTDYVLNYDNGSIYFECYEFFEEGWTFYCYYNYSGGNGQSGLFVSNGLNYSLVLNVENNLISGNMNDGIQAFGSNITIQNNAVSENTGSGVWLENCTGEIFNNAINENHHTYGGGGSPEMSGVDLLNCSEVYVGYNNISENDVNIYLENSRNVTIEWNEMLDETQEYYTGGPVPRGIYSIASQMTASNNTIWGTSIGIDIEDADNNTVLANNNFYRIDPLDANTGAQVGIRLLNASAILERNTFNGIGYGIRCYDNSSAYIHNNTITNCSNDGINSEWSEATITGNNISGNGGWGILSKYAALTNAGINGTGLISDNPLLGNNTLGMATQLWQVRVLVWNDTTNQSQSYKEVCVNDTYSDTWWQGYTDGSGYTETIILAQYEKINATTTWIYTPYSFNTDNSGVPMTIYAIVGGNIIATIHID